MKEFVLLVVLTTAAGAGYFLYKDYHSHLENDENANREPIGEMVVSENTVKRQFNQEVIWNNISKKELVYNQDSVRTGKESSAAIRLADNTIIELNENSLIVLDKNQNNFNINFKAGNIAAKNSSDKLQIQVKGSMIKTLGAEVNIKTGADAKTKIQVIKGKATIQDKNKIMQVGENEQTSLDEKGASDVVKVGVVLKSPENKTQISSNGSNLKQTFTWQVLAPGITREYFEISKSPNFTKDQTKTFQAHQAISAPVNQGPNYWRVGWDDSKRNRLYTEVRQFTLGYDKRLELLYPENQTRFELDPEENNMELQWKSLIAAKAYMIEVSHSEDFRNLVYSQPLGSAQQEMKVILKNLEPGIYYWRVKAFGEKNDVLGTSAVFNFGIKLKLPTLPELLRPANEWVWNESSPVTFSWKKLDKAQNYRLVISSDMEQKNIVKTQTQKESSFVWPSKFQQVVYWSVTALNAKATPFAKSELRKLTVQKSKLVSAFILVSPRDRFEVQREIGPNADPVLFQWKIARPLPGTVKLIVANNEEFTNPIIKADLKKYSESVKLDKEGMYFWKLESQSPTNKDLVETSEVSSFILKHVNLIAAPELIAPEGKEKIEVSEPQPVKFSWKPVAGAVQYHIVVENVDTKTLDKKTIMDKVIKETSVDSIPIGEGVYTWSVSSFDSEGQEGSTSRSRDFSLIPFEAVEAPQLNNPVVK